MSILQELIRRGVIKNALAGRDEKWLRIMIAFLKKHITNPNFASTVIDITNMLLGEFKVKSDSGADNNDLCMSVFFQSPNNQTFLSTVSLQIFTPLSSGNRTSSSATSGD